MGQGASCQELCHEMSPGFEIGRWRKCSMSFQDEHTDYQSSGIIISIEVLASLWSLECLLEERMRPTCSQLSINSTEAVAASLGVVRAGATGEENRTFADTPHLRLASYWTWSWTTVICTRFCAARRHERGERERERFYMPWLLPRRVVSRASHVISISKWVQTGNESVHVARYRDIYIYIYSYLNRVCLAVLPSQSILLAR